MSKHDWGPSNLNHGSQQCKRCLCTYEEAKYALGMECGKSLEEQRKEILVKYKDKIDV